MKWSAEDDPNTISAYVDIVSSYPHQAMTNRFPIGEPKVKKCFYPVGNPCFFVFPILVLGQKNVLQKIYFCMLKLS